MLRRRHALSPLERRLGYRFRRRELLERALAHRSFANEQGLEHNYERLEFLGDAVLGLVTAEWLFLEHSDVAEGRLSVHMSRLVSEAVLADFARGLQLGEFVRLGVGEERSGGRDKDSILSDCLEAVLGAAFLDGGWKVARRLVRTMLDGDGGGEAAGETAGEAQRDPKGRLQELAQARGLALPEYRLLESRGPDHEKTFVTECLVAGEPLARGAGRTKKRSQQRAAAGALEVLVQREDSA